MDSEGLPRFNPSLPSTFSVFPNRQDGSTDSKQTSKGLFIFQLSLERQNWFSALLFLMPTAINWEMNNKELRCRFKEHLASSGLDFYIYTTWEIELAQCIHCTWRWSVNIKQTLVCAKLELLTRFLVNVWWFQHSENPFLCRQGNWTSDNCSSTAYGFHNLLRWFVNQIMVVWL